MTRHKVENIVGVAEVDGRWELDAEEEAASIEDVSEDDEEEEVLAAVDCNDEDVDGSCSGSCTPISSYGRTAPCTPLSRI